MDTNSLGSGAAVPVAILAVAFGLVLASMFLSWKKKSAAEAGRDDAVKGIVWNRHFTTGMSGEQVGAGEYVSTTVADRPLERLHCMGLGTRAKVIVSRIHDPGSDFVGLELSWQNGSRTGQSLYIHFRDLIDVFPSRGMIGKWMGTDSLTVFRWRAEHNVFDTGILFPYTTMRERALQLASRRTSPFDKEIS